MPTLLIVDDHASVLHTLEFVFAGPDLRIRLAESGAAALALAEQDAFNAALVDLHMPAMDGLALTRALRPGRSDLAHERGPGHRRRRAIATSGRGGAIEEAVRLRRVSWTLLQRLNGGAAPATFAA